MGSLKEYIYIGLKYIAIAFASYFALSNTIGCSWINLKSLLSLGGFNTDSRSCIIVILMTCVLFIWALMECPDIFNKNQKKCEYKEDALKRFNDIMFYILTVILSLLLLCATKRYYSPELVMGISGIIIVLLIIKVIWAFMSTKMASGELYSDKAAWRETGYYSIAGVVFIISLIFINHIPFFDMCYPSSYISDFLHKYLLTILLLYIPLSLFKIFTGVSKDINPNKSYNEFKDKYKDEL